MKRIKYLAALLLCAGIANAQVITPTAVTFTGTATSDEGNALNVPEAIIDGSGLSAALTVSNLTTVTHAGVSLTAGSENAWATLSGGDGGDFYSNNTDTVVFEFDLGGTVANIDTFASWGYHFGGYQGNSIFDVTLDFSTDGGTTTASSQTISVPFESSPDLATLVTLAPVTANYITMTVNDNQFGNAAGGDRVGIAEIRFASGLVLPDPVALITSFTATPSSVTNGGITTLAWTTTDADTASLDQGIGAVPASGSTQIVVNAETTYTLTASNAFNSTNQAVTVSIQSGTRTLIVPTAVTYTGDAPVLGGLNLDIPDNLINSNGLTSAIAPDASNIGAVEHLAASFAAPGNAWVTTDPNGSTGDFYSNNTTTVIFEFDLGSEFSNIDTFASWGYHFDVFGGNSISNVTLNFSTDGGTTTDSSQTVAVPLPSAPNLASLVALTPVTANHITMTVNDNYFGSVEGGDRVGLAEIRFVSTFVEAPIGNITISGPVAITGGQGMLLSWDTSDTQSYNINTKSNLITQASWQTVTNVIGDGGSITVTTAVDNAENFYQVETPAP